MGLGVSRRMIAAVTVIRESDLDRRAGQLVELIGLRRDLRLPLFVGWVTRSAAS